MDRRTVTPTPSPCSKACTDLATVRELKDFDIVKFANSDVLELKDLASKTEIKIARKEKKGLTT